MTSPYAPDDGPADGDEESARARVFRLLLVAFVLLVLPMLLIGAMLPHLDGCGGG